ncbi:MULTISPECIES: TrkA family potassium uptake protein [unclassified Treponema]|uniref:potassium channel family protein n=1 Tax=unclassified Treponema TaxID=2638727 RepID=UPI00053013C1|nr:MULTISPECIES: TrkA family potassium uptake protein [unclassified Treponema]AIW88527.1 potassium transporter Trk [Treponema sp. OMZ 838]UTC44121.1 TrkA family potassium uptake protein [Treponema sp. OMZ 857]UTC51466.1 TrkA family potassium uptake protein [Treponema sp. OMZ 855]
MDVQQNFAVIGLGEFGIRICEMLAEGGGSVVAFDHDAQAVDRVKKIVPAAMVIDTTDENALRKAPLDDIDVAIVAIGDNKEASILTTTLLKEREIPYIVARAVSPLHAIVLKRVGASRVLKIEEESASRIANELINPEALNSLSVVEGYGICEVKVPKFFIGKTLSQVALKEKFNITLITVVRLELDIDTVGNPLNREAMYEPDDNLELQTGDKLFVFGSLEKITEFRNI